MFPSGRVNGVPVFRWKGQRSRSQDIKNLHSNLASCLLRAGLSSARCSGSNCRLDMACLKFPSITTRRNSNDGCIYNVGVDIFACFVHDYTVLRIRLFIWSWASAAGKCSLSCRASSWSPRALFWSRTIRKNSIAPWFWHLHAQCMSQVLSCAYPWETGLTFSEVPWIILARFHILGKSEERRQILKTPDEKS